MYVTVSVTCAGDEEAGRIADLLVDGRLAACVHLSAVASRYVWRGERVTDEEVLLTVVTRSDRFDELVATVTAAHSYEVPAVLATELVGGAEPYLRWIDEQLDAAPPGPAGAPTP